MKIKLSSLLVLMGALVLSLSSCVSSKKMVYLQGIDPAEIDSLVMKQNYELTIEPDDQLAISFNSKNEELIAPFNNNTLINSGNSRSGGTQANTSAGITYFQVSEEGYIHFPIFGDLYVKGMSRNQLARELEKKLIDGEYLKDPTVSVKIMSFKVTVLGEVRNPGVQKITGERLTVLEALGMAGDLLPSGRREEVLVIREENGVRVPHCINLTSGRDILDSPCYYLQQNDLVYVKPNSSIAVKGSPLFQYVTAGGSIVSVLASIVSLIVVFSK